MEYIIFVGYLAVAFQTIRYLPQVIKGFKTKKVHDISGVWLFTGTIAAILWIIYGFFIYAIQIVIANIVNLICYLCMIYQKQAY